MNIFYDTALLQLDEINIAGMFIDRNNGSKTNLWKNTNLLDGIAPGVQLFMQDNVHRRNDIRKNLSGRFASYFIWIRSSSFSSHDVYLVDISIHAYIATCSRHLQQRKQSIILAARLVLLSFPLSLPWNLFDFLKQWHLVQRLPSTNPEKAKEITYYVQLHKYLFVVGSTVINRLRIFRDIKK